MGKAGENDKSGSILEPETGFGFTDYISAPASLSGGPTQNDEKSRKKKKPKRKVE